MAKRGLGGQRGGRLGKVPTRREGGAGIKPLRVGGKAGGCVRVRGGERAGERESGRDRGRAGELERERERERKARTISTLYACT